MADVSHADNLEGLCRRCGMSCHFAVPVNGLPVVIDELRCRYLSRGDDGRYACSVYAERYQRAPWCHSAVEALPRGMLAQDCPYGRALLPSGSLVRGKARLSPRLLPQVLPAIIDDILRGGVPGGADPLLVVALLTRQRPPPLGQRWGYDLRGTQAAQPGQAADAGRYWFALTGA